MTCVGMRSVARVVRGTHVREGAGVDVCRTLGTSALKSLDPFLMLDELRCPAQQAAAGFPDHPHRGFETCSIMLSGAMEHRDSVGNQGIIRDGGVQWMTAGRGIIHSEMPRITSGDLWGFQLWVNLPKKDKMVRPRYQDYQAEDIPVYEDDDVRVRIMAGEAYGKTGVIVMRNPGMLLDVTVKSGGAFEAQVSEEFNAFCYVCDGAGKICGQSVTREHAVVLSRDGDTVQATAQGGSLRFLLVAGRPIGEPIVQYGPFVMNTEAEIEQAFHDYHTGKLQNPKDNVWGEWEE